MNKKRTEIKQNTTPAECPRIRTWFWTLYERTLKVIVEAVLERVWPK